MAAKVHRTNAKGSVDCKASDIVRISNYEIKDVHKAEQELLQRIEYRCTQPSASQFLKDYVREYFGRGRPECLDKTLFIARQHKLERVIEDRVFFFTPPSKIAFGIARYSIEMYEDKSIHDNGRFHAFAGYDADCYEDVLSSITTGT